MALPQLTPEQRQANLDKAAASRRERAAVKNRLKHSGASIIDVIDAGIDGLGPERALGFGGEQMLLQNRALLDLMEARAEARDRADG